MSHDTGKSARSRLIPIRPIDCAFGEQGQTNLSYHFSPISPTRGKCLIGGPENQRTAARVSFGPPVLRVRPTCLPECTIDHHGHVRLVLVDELGACPVRIPRPAMAPAPRPAPMWFAYHTADRAAPCTRQQASGECLRAICCRRMSPENGRTRKSLSTTKTRHPKLKQIVSHLE